MKPRGLEHLQFYLWCKLVFASDTNVVCSLSWQLRLIPGTLSFGQSVRPRRSKVYWLKFIHYELIEMDKKHCDMTFHNLGVSLHPVWNDYAETCTQSWSLCEPHFISQASPIVCYVILRALYSRRVQLGTFLAVCEVPFSVASICLPWFR